MVSRTPNTNPHTALKVIEHVVIIIVVEAEVSPILDQLQFEDDEDATELLMGLGKVRSGEYQSYWLSVVQADKSSPVLNLNPARISSSLLIYLATCTY